ncbi:MAG: branched-chain amino acid ABC transporter permease [Betaproteobacteria bacterium]
MITASPGAKPSAILGNGSAIAALKQRFRRQDAILMGLLFVGLALFPRAPGTEGWMLAQAAVVIIYIIAAQGVALLVGYTGLVTVGHGGFLAIGAYTAALLTKLFGVDILVAIVAGGFMSAVVGMLLGLVFLRLAGPFMAIGTLGFAFFIGTVVNNVPLFEGREGISLPPTNRLLGMQIGDAGFYYVALFVLALVTLFLYSLLRSGVGRAVRALRDSEKAAESSGVNRLFYRTLAFSISACITGLAGALHGLVIHYVSAEVYGDIWYSVDLLVAVVVGGASMLMGPFVGGLFVVMVPFFLDQLADFASILKGVVLILVLIFAPAGVCEVVGRPFRAWRRRKLIEVGRTPEPEVGQAITANR